MSNHFLEAAAQEFADATSRPPFLYELGADGARKVLDDVQAAPIAKPEVADTWVTVPADVGDVRVRILKPLDAVGVLPAILYMHGGGWVLGSAGTHDRLVRELTVGANAAVVFVEYDRSPEAHYYPVTDAAQDTDSYREFADGPFLTAKSMAWFWDAYLPDQSARAEITASPLRASVNALAGLPEAFLIVDENDVLRDEGEAYGRKLTAAGVRTTCVRYNGILHDFMMLNPLRHTAAPTGAIEQAIHVLRKALGTH
jgi:acetyl esterase